MRGQVKARNMFLSVSKCRSGLLICCVDVEICMGTEQGVVGPIRSLAGGCTHWRRSRQRVREPGLLFGLHRGSCGGTRNRSHEQTRLADLPTELCVVLRATADARVTETRSEGSLQHTRKEPSRVVCCQQLVRVRQQCKRRWRPLRAAVDRLAAASSRLEGRCTRTCAVCLV
jgi:hypothetical protein